MARFAPRHRSIPDRDGESSTILPDLDKYKGPPLEYGRMEPTASDPGVHQQYGMIVGKPNAGQVNAIGTFNIRGERSVTCKGEYDLHPSKGPLPKGAPPVCEFFRQQPDALERAAELDAQFGRNPDLEKMPMYGVVFSFKDSFDTADMRSTGAGDAAYDMDFPARDHLLVQQLRDKGAIIFAKAINTEYNGRAGDPGGRNRPEKVLASTLGHQRSSWGGNAVNPYDTTRAASLGSSSGSALSVSVNLVMASSARKPARPVAAHRITMRSRLFFRTRRCSASMAARSVPTCIATAPAFMPARLSTAPRSLMRSRTPTTAITIRATHSRQYRDPR